MKLAEALALRADLSTRAAQLANRAAQNSRVQEGDEAEENSAALLARFEETSAELESLVTNINVTNLATEVRPGLTMTAALARRERLRSLHQLLTRIADEGSARPGRYSRTELRTLSTVDVPSLRERAEATARELRELDSRVQETNWLTELIGG